MLTYLDFDLRIEPAAEGYRARGRDSAGQDASVPFQVPFAESEIKSSWWQRDDSRELAKKYGGALFKALFHGDLGRCFHRGLERASGAGLGLRILLHLVDVPELSYLPWEYLYDDSFDRFLALSEKTPLVRYLDLPEPFPGLAVRPPLKMLVVVASPSGPDQLGVEQEWRSLNEALGGLQERGWIQVERLEGATLTALRRRLRRGDVHVLHFIGHGGFDQTSQQGTLLLEDEHGFGQPVRAEDLGVILHDPALRLVFLNVCEGARASRLNPFAGVAQTLVRQGVPAVVAVETNVRDDVAVILARELYGALADDYSIDACLVEARKALFTRQDAAWGTPVLYLRAPNGRIFREVPATYDRTGESAALGGTSIPSPPALVPAALEDSAVTVRDGQTSRVKWVAVAALMLAVSSTWAWRHLTSDKKPIPGDLGPEVEPPPAKDQPAEVAPPPRSSAAPDPAAPEPAVPTVATLPASPEPLPVASSWPREEGLYRNDRDGQDYVWIPGGSFLFGCSPGDDLCEDDERPATDQTIEDGFWLGRTEVTVRAYKQFRQHPSQMPPAPSFNVGWQDEAQPIVNVSRPEAMRFCEWAATRLPTEVEWEYAARAGERRFLPKDLPSKAWFLDQSGERAHPVGQKEPNAFGLYDMLGNASEWVAPRPDEPADFGVLRGGSWLHAEQFLRFSFRLREAPSERYEMYGFRCLAEAP